MPTATWSTGSAPPTTPPGAVPPMSTVRPTAATCDSSPASAGSPPCSMGRATPSSPTGRSNPWPSTRSSPPHGPWHCWPSTSAAPLDPLAQSVTRHRLRKPAPDGWLHECQSDRDPGHPRLVRQRVERPRSGREKSVDVDTGLVAGQPHPRLSAPPVFDRDDPGAHGIVETHRRLDLTPIAAHDDAVPIGQTEPAGIADVHVQRIGPP